LGLTSEQIGFFKTNGYLIVPGMMDLELCVQTRKLMWDALPEEAALVEQEPATHVGPFKAARSTDAVHTRDGHRWLNRLLGVNETVIELIYSQSICAAAQQLLGGTLRQAVVDGQPMGSHGSAWPGGPTDPALGNEGARGVYCTLSYGQVTRKPDTCHTDGHPFQLGIVGLIHDTPADGGAFKVWPRSHARLFHTYALRYDQPRIPFYGHLPKFKGLVYTPEYLREIDQLNIDTQAVECCGSAGDVVFWHHRTAHMAGHNYSDVLRQAVLADFWTTELDDLRSRPVTDDMWSDWSEVVQSSNGAFTNEFAVMQGLGASKQFQNVRVETKHAR
jgi:hypothetical protein